MYTFDRIGQVFTITAGPTYTYCGEQSWPIQGTDLIFEAYEASNGPLDWITVDPISFDITISPGEA